ncbi:hypothetical protein EU534_01040 [Candidatus Heimdallarchaeota archaeon]|nr:MAG: hypothetical protein EU534_01040 [Candidatus Heimdallarchaeota archaeon]
MKRSTLFGIILILIVGTGVGGFFLIDTIINNYFSGEVNIVAVIWPNNTSIKGEPIEISVVLKLEGINKATLELAEIGISSLDYSLNDSTKLFLNKEIVRGSNFLTMEIGPLLNLSNGYFALNVGEYKVNSLNFGFINKVQESNISLDFTFNIKNPEEVERIINGDFNDYLNSWEGGLQDNRTVATITTHPSLYNNSIRFTNVEEINPGDSTWISISQTLDLTQAYYLSFEQVIESTNCSIEVNLFINEIKQDMTLDLNTGSEQYQNIHFGEGEGISEVTLQIVFVYADNSTNVYLDNLSILSYEHRVFVFMLNDNWEISGSDLARNDLFTTMLETSDIFERELGIKLIPVLELPWYPEDVSMSIIDETALETAGNLLGLDNIWDTEYGRSSNNNGFDLLTSFSNQTSDHFGFAYYENNAAFHFAESEELGDFSYLGIIADWAENLVQHEIAHNFGALDRDRTFDPPSVMSKPVTPQQVWDDFYYGRLWLQVNNWLIEDILLMLENRAMFD